MTEAARVPVTQLQPGDVVRTHRTAPAYVVAEAVLEHGCSWRVRGRDGITRDDAARAAVLSAEPGLSAAQLQVAS